MSDIRIVIDYREKASGIPDLLIDRGVEVEYRALRSGDYFINNKITVERKTKEDFVQSVISNRLFVQCQRLKRYNEYPLLVIEGNPLQTPHRISPKAIKGAIMSVSIAWQIPMLTTERKEETVDMLIMAGHQTELAKVPVVRSGYKPKRIRSRKRDKFMNLSGIPNILINLQKCVLSQHKPVDLIIPDIFEHKIN